MKNLLVAIFIFCLFTEVYSQVEIGPCTDVGEVDFGECDMVLGVAVVNGVCTYLSGCDWAVNGIDYSPAFYDSIASCDEGCIAFVVEPCMDIEGVDFGLCLAILGIANVGGSCTYLSGCSTYSNGIDYSPAFYVTIEDCVIGCDNLDCISEELLSLGPFIDCPDIWEPVCGCDGNTYSNICYAMYYGGVTSWIEVECGGLVEGCTYDAAYNFNPFATDDDGSCEFPDCGSDCIGDLDGDSTVTVGDILTLLSNFGAVCD